MNSNDNGAGRNALSAGVYYGATALIVIGIAISVIFGRVFYARKNRREWARRNERERLEAQRRGEEPGLPTYHDPGQTVAVPLPVINYPDAVYRPPNGQPDPSLPGYEVAPPKYEYDHAEHSDRPDASSATPENAEGQTESSASRPVEMQQTRSRSFLASVNPVYPAPPPFEAANQLEGGHLSTNEAERQRGDLSSPSNLQEVSLDDDTTPNADARNRADASSSSHARA